MHGFEDIEQQALAGRREQVDAVEVGEAGEGGGIGVRDQPLAGVAALEAGGSERGAAEQILGQGLLAGAVFAFNGGHLDVRGDHVGLGQQLAPGSADADDLDGRLCVSLDQGQARAVALWLELSGALHHNQRASPPWRYQRYQANSLFIDGGRENLKGRGVESGSWGMEKRGGVEGAPRS